MSPIVFLPTWFAEDKCEISGNLRFETTWFTCGPTISVHDHDLIPEDAGDRAIRSKVTVTRFNFQSIFGRLKSKTSNDDRKILPVLLVQLVFEIYYFELHFIRSKGTWCCSPATNGNFAHAPQAFGSFSSWARRGSWSPFCKFIRSLNTGDFRSYM